MRHTVARDITNKPADETTEELKKIILKIRRPLMLMVGASLFGVSVWLGRNVQIEGLFFGAITGVTLGAVTHYVLKLVITLVFGRVWCGWACWTGALLDQLPFRKSTGWVRGPWRDLRYVHLGLSLSLVLVMVGLGFRDGALGSRAIWWFVTGNILYWCVGVGLALALRDNRAFCKYVCPVSVLLKTATRPALVKIAGDAHACLECKSRACKTLCPMDIEIPEYIGAGRRLLSSECIFCQQCVAICPPNTLKISVGLDCGGQDILEERAVQAAPSAPRGGDVCAKA